MKNFDPNQLEMIDLRRSKARPAGGGQLIDGAFVFNAQSQRVDQVAYSIGEVTNEHVYHLIAEGEFPNARDISTTTASRACYRVPRCDVIEFLEVRKEGGAR